MEFDKIKQTCWFRFTRNKATMLPVSQKCSFTYSVLGESNFESFEAGLHFKN